MYAEYGARVKINGLCDYPDSKGTIVHVEPYLDGARTVGRDVYTVRLDVNGECATFDYEEFDVTLAPSESAYRLTQRNSVDELLAVVEQMPDVMGDAYRPGVTVYSTALVFELYRLNYHAEQAIRWDVEQQIAEELLNRQATIVVTLDTERSEFTFWHASRDDGTGYPVYPVED
jgi:hypothetical protein